MVNESIELPNLHHYIDNIMETIPASIYLKDKKGLYLQANPAFLKSTVKTSSDEVVGLTDHDLSWKEEASIMQKNDNEVMYTEQPKTIIEPAKCFEDKKIRFFLSHKSPFRLRSGKIIGAFGISFLLNDEKKCWREPIAESKHKSFLTPKESLCIKHLMMGMTIKQIAKKLLLSPRTVETHFNNIKRKVEANNITDMVVKLMLKHPETRFFA